MSQEKIEQIQKSKDALGKGSLLPAIKMHFCHSVGGSVLLLPFAVSKVGMPAFLYGLFIYTMYDIS